MVSLPLREVMVASDSAERSHKLARRLIESALTDREEIEKFDKSLSPENPLDFDRQSAGMIRLMYEQWANDVEALLARISDVEQRFGAVAEVAELRHAWGKTKAMLSISLDDMEAGCRDIKEGRLHSIEEVRHELHLPPR
jgi:hypothetical protein